MVRQAALQAIKKKKRLRYNDPGIMRFAMNLRNLGGPIVYEILHANLGKGVFPSPRTVESWLAAYDLSVPEGQINVKMLKEILVQHNLPL